jgi:L-lactate dehydrogenase complex protein LldG
MPGNSGDESRSLGARMSKEAILGAIRRGLKRGALPEDQAMALRARLSAHPRQLIPARSRLPRPGQIALLVRNIEKEFGTVARVARPDDVPAAVTDYLAAQNLPTDLAMAPHPELQSLPWHERPMLHIRTGRAMPGDLVSLQHGYAAVAETGTLVLPSGPDRPTTLNLLSDTTIVVLRASRRDALSGGFMPRNVMLVTGPSRSADIESVLELGAHGPRRLHVVLIDDDPDAVDHAVA